MFILYIYHWHTSMLKESISKIKVQTKFILSNPHFCKRRFCSHQQKAIRKLGLRRWTIPCEMKTWVITSCLFSDLSLGRIHEYFLIKAEVEFLNADQSWRLSVFEILNKMIEIFKVLCDSRTWVERCSLKSNASLSSPSE